MNSLRRSWLPLLLSVVLATACRDRPAPPPTSSPVASADPWPAEAAAPARWIVDGDGREWDGADGVVRGRDAEGDAKGPLDVVAIAATARGRRLLIRIDIAEVANLYSGARDEGTAVLQVGSGSDQLELDLRARRLRRGSERIRLADAGLWVAPAHAAKTFELSFDLEALDWKPGARVRVGMGKGDRVAPVELELPVATPSSAELTLAKKGDHLRIASFNTLEHGILDLDRGEAQRRLLGAMHPDIVLLQELGRASAEHAAQALGMPHGIGKKVDRIVGHAVVSRFPLTELPTSSDRFVAALVQSPTPVVAIAVHLSCCGYLGSDQDGRRLKQARDLAGFIRRVRAGQIAGCPEGMPVIVAGDFNDVGSPALRAEVASASVRRIPLAHPRWASAHTWGTLGAKYPASILDHMFASADADWKSGFILDTAELTDAELTALHLQRSDSAASDHRVLVADFHPR